MDTSPPPAEPGPRPPHSEAASPPPPPDPRGAASAGWPDPRPVSRSAAGRIPWVWRIAGPLVALTLAAVALAASVRLPYISVAPGSARSVEPLVSVKGNDARANDDILFLTVSVRRTTGVEALIGWLDDEVEVEPERLITGGQPEQENRKFNQQLMTTSKETATKVALEKLGYTVATAPAGAVVTDVAADLPVFGSLSPGDTVVEAAGRPVATSEDLIEAVRTTRPGDVVPVRVRPLGGGELRSVEVRTVPRPGEPQRAYLGIGLETRQAFQFPIEVGIDSGKVGGPSAGLAFTLAVLDRLTPGRLTGGQKVAVTGTIDSNGGVGPVGGVHQKAIAATDAGARLMLVPTAEYEEALRAARGRIRVAPVASLDDALAVLAPLGGNAGSLGRPGAPPPAP